MNSASLTNNSTTLFQGISWGLFTIAFLQVLLFGFGVIKRLQAPAEVKTQEKIVTKYVAVRSSQSPKIAQPEQFRASQRPSAQKLPDLPPLPKGFNNNRVQPTLPEQVNFNFDPPVHDPLEQKLLKEAQAARVAGDMRLMAIKLEEANESFPKSPHATFLFADMFEAMEIYDRASEYYEQVFSMGLANAGSLYRIAAQKLKRGFIATNEQPTALRIGSISEFRDERIETGESVNLTIPLISSPERVISPSEVSVTVHIFDKIGEQVVPCLPSNQAVCDWKERPVNWEQNGLEHLSGNYFLPSVPVNGEFDPLGPRSYHGYVIELYYQGELIDLIASPRALAGKISGQSQFDLMQPFDDAEFDINYQSLLLPLPEE